jgi:arginyl-tRNA synthetase
MKEQISELVSKAIDELKSSGMFKSGASVDISIGKPKVESFGDYSTNAAILMAKPLGSSPMDLARAIAKKIAEMDNGRTLKKIDVAPPGFINFILSEGRVRASLSEALRSGDKYGTSKRGAGKKVLLEFVSANPTGPLHVGHGRWAAIGDALASILKAAGYRVDREFYVNDIGKQIDLLARSVIARANNEQVPEGGYGGGYIIEIAKTFKSRLKDRGLANKVIELILSEQKSILEKMRVRFDKWSYESDLHKGRKVQKAIDELKRKGVTFVEDGALWFKSKEYGDDKNRVLIRNDGVSTYFSSDIAYHIDKFKRGYDLLINVWGTDHHGYVARLKVALKSLGYPSDRLKIIIGQLVSLFRGGEPVRMSKRTGEMVTLQEVVDEIGVDATRFYFLMLSADSHLEFDLEIAKRQTMDNPVYYVQYAHARISSILREAEKRGISVKRALSAAKLDLLSDEEELKLIKKIISYPDELLESAAALLPHRIITFARELSAQFHNFYHKLRVVSDDRELSEARIALVFATRIVLKNVLKLLNISAPESM